MATELDVQQTTIPGLLRVDLAVHEDPRGWFKENWQRGKMVALGLPDFGPVQHNISFNTNRGVTRGVHAEPWDKFVSIATGRVFGAWVDLRKGSETFGQSYSCELGPHTAVFVPRGVGNSYQVLEDGTAYSYLVNAHWRSDGEYANISPADPALGIDWPIALCDPAVELSEKDRTSPPLDQVRPLAPKPVLVVGATGQIGRALVNQWPGTVGITRGDLDLSDPVSVSAFDFSPYEVVVNAAAHTNVDGAETAEGRPRAWAVNAAGPALLARKVAEVGGILVHYSSDYVFDGMTPTHHEDEAFSPLGVYGQSKAAGDLAVASCPRHFIVRTTWVIGEGANFVRTMRKLALDGIRPSVVADQVGRLSFATDVAAATRHLVESGAPFGTYNVTNSGAALSWADVARHVFALSGAQAEDVTDTNTAAYSSSRVVAPRPANSVMDLSKLEATGWTPRDQLVALIDYLTEDGSTPTD